MLDWLDLRSKHRSAPAGVVASKQVASQASGKHRSAPATCWPVGYSASYAHGHVSLSPAPILLHLASYLWKKQKCESRFLGLRSLCYLCLSTNKNQMDRKARMGTLAIGLLGFVIFVATVTGDAQKVIKFQSADNEIAFASIVFTASIFAMVLGLAGGKNEE